MSAERAGIHVRLVWFQRTNEVAVELDDTRAGEAFTVALCGRVSVLGG